MENQKFTRRDFLRLTGMGTAGLVAASCIAPAMPADEGQAAVDKARKTLRLQSSFPIDYPNTLVMSQNVFAEFKESHPDFEVEVNFVPVPDIARTFLQAREADQAPDFFYSADSQGTLDYLGHLYDLAELVKEEGLWDDFYQSAKDLWSNTEGELVGIMTDFGVKCYVYRADIWDEAGLDPEKFPTTWEEFQEVVIKLTKKDAAGNNERDGYHMFEDINLDTEHLLQHMHQNGGSEYSGDKATGPAAINSPEALEAFTWWLDLIRKHGIESKRGTNTPEGSESLLDGYVGVELQGPWWVPTRRLRRPELFDQDIVRVGAPLQRKAQVGHMDVTGFSVNAHSGILPDVLDYVRIYLKDEHYMHTHDAVSADGQIVYQAPCSRRSINEHSDFWIAQEPLVRDSAYLQSFDIGQSTSRMHLGFSEVRTYVYSRMAEQGLYEILDDQAVLDAAAQQMDAITERTMRELE